MLRARGYSNLLFIHMHSLLFPSKRDAAPGGRRTLWLWAGSSALAFLLMVSSFFLYVDAERTLEKTAEQRLNAVLAAEKMRHTTEGLTRMARNYILSGKPEFKRWYFELDDIRLGKTKEPTNQYMWDLRVYGEIHNMEVLANSMPLHTYFESVAKEDDQGKFLREAWAQTNARDSAGRIQDGRRGRQEHRPGQHAHLVRDVQRHGHLQASRALRLD